MELDDNLLKVEANTLASGSRNYDKWLSTPPTRDSLLNRAYIIDSLYLERFFSKRKEHSSLSTFAKNHIYYNYLMERSKHFNVRAFVSNQVSKDYKRDLLKLSESLTCDSCIQMYPYRKLASNYLEYISASVPIDSQINFIDQKFKGQSRDFLLFNLFKNSSNSNSGFFKANLQDFLQRCSDESYKNYVRNLNYDVNMIADLEIYDSKGKTFSLADLIARNTGRLIYIDLWASWCDPCIDELPSSFLLSKAYLDKPITFIYLSLDKNKNVWESAMKRLGMSTENSYIIPSAFSSKLAAKFKITSIPRYLLIDKNGRVINADEMRPSDSKLPEIISRHL